MASTFYPAWIAACAAGINEHKDYLTDLDRRIGDADHGLNMDRGMTLAAAIEPGEDAAAYIKQVALTLVSRVGGASGPLYGTFFLQFSRALASAEDPGSDAAFLAAFAEGIAGVKKRGGAEVGEKTMLDALVPALEAGRGHEGEGLPAVTEAMSIRAKEAAEATRDLVATKGRASYLGERSAGTIDPGAASSALIIAAAKEASAQ